MKQTLTTGNMTITENQIKRTKIDWENIAKESINIEVINDVIYGFCSELGALRLGQAYSGSKNYTKADYSENLRSWFFVLETS